MANLSLEKAGGAGTKTETRSEYLTGPITKANDMQLISRDELKVKLDRGDNFKLVMTLGPWQFDAKHIPGSLHITSIERALELLEPDDDIVVYCSNPACGASVFSYWMLTDAGFANVRRFAGGVAEWEAAGYPLEGRRATKGRDGSTTSMRASSRRPAWWPREQRRAA